MRYYYGNLIKEKGCVRNILSHNVYLFSSLPQYYGVEKTCLVETLFALSNMSSFIRTVLLACIFWNGLICFMSTETKNVAHEKNISSGETKKRGETFVCKKASDCKNNTECEKNVCIPKCNHTSDCDDPRMTCKNGLCSCSLFHYRTQSIECIPNISRIMLWLKNSSSLDSETESQGSAFTKNEEPHPIWAEYQGAREVGLGFIPKPVWPVVICIGLLLLVYSLILYDII